MIGWATLRDDIEMLSDAKMTCRLETVRLEITVPTRKKLQELAWVCVGEGCQVNLHTPDFVTIVAGKNDERAIDARVRSGS